MFKEISGELVIDEMIGRTPRNEIYTTDLLGYRYHDKIYVYKNRYTGARGFVKSLEEWKELIKAVRKHDKTWKCILITKQYQEEQRENNTCPHCKGTGKRNMTGY